MVFHFENLSKISHRDILYFKCILVENSIIDLGFSKVSLYAKQYVFVIMCIYVDMFLCLHIYVDICADIHICQ